MGTFNIYLHFKYTKQISKVKCFFPPTQQSLAGIYYITINPVATARNIPNEPNTNIFIKYKISTYRLAYTFQLRYLLEKCILVTYFPVLNPIYKTFSSALYLFIFLTSL